ncbi:hypothetical protein C1752_09739 [Acaryochloris thomasi RCC1774]|uniref:Uncharacterized protein n=1 Tax=Acaryochloris thomasi RCC1774 TaxID=1764569 RepID=A0A2W1JI35_9CYAN|nr:hypothetical protein C1752_09739 [Acaryochloris thomasi RCC1774]
MICIDSPAMLHELPRDTGGLQGKRYISQNVVYISLDFNGSLFS